MPTNQAPALPKVHIEVMIDTNVNSRNLDGDFKTVRELLEFRDYMAVAGRLDGVDYEVTQRDTAQIFHEKTSCITPELAKEAGIEIYPSFVRENLESGVYHVEPPIHGEDEYYRALAKYFLKILPEKAPHELRNRKLSKPEDFTPRDLQDLYREHMGPNLERKYRQGKYASAFEAYHEVRFNAGEETAINFLRNHPHPPAGERTAFIFVGADKWANESMGKARAGKADQGKFEVFVGGANQFRQIIDKIVREVEKQHPELRHLRHSNFRELSQLGGDFNPPAFPHDRMAGDRMITSGEPLPAPFRKKQGAAQETRNETEEARNFADFVLGLRQEPDQKRSQGR